VRADGHRHCRGQRRYRPSRDQPDYQTNRQSGGGLSAGGHVQPPPSGLLCASRQSPPPDDGHHDAGGYQSASASSGYPVHDHQSPTSLHPTRSSARLVSELSATSWQRTACPLPSSANKVAVVACWPLKPTTSTISRTARLWRSS